MRKYIPVSQDLQLFQPCSLTHKLAAKLSPAALGVAAADPPSPVGRRKPPPPPSPLGPAADLLPVSRARGTAMAVTTTATPKIPSNHFRTVCKEKCSQTASAATQGPRALPPTHPPSLSPTHLHGAERSSAAAERLPTAQKASGAQSSPAGGGCRCDPAAARGDVPWERHWTPGRGAGGGCRLQEARSARHPGC